MRICKQLDFIKGSTLEDLKEKMNEALRNGAEYGGIDIGSLTGIIIMTVYVGEIEKTELDLLEEEFGCHKCSDCPFYEEPTDRRRKWNVCQKGKRVQATSCCCTVYYESLREEEKCEISENQGNDGLLRSEGRGCGGVAEGFADGGIQQTQRAVKIPPIGKGIPFGIPEDTNRRIIQGGARC